ncbi:MAG TPA: hypothetical protein VF068_01725 [Rubrobacter sp.]
MNNRRTQREEARPATASPSTTLGGRRLAFLRAAWLAVAVLTLGLDAASVPYYYERDKGVCVACAGDSGRLTLERLHALREMGLSAGFYAGYDTAIEVVAVLVFVAVATVIFLHRSEDRMALFGSFTLLMFGGAAFSSDLLHALAVAHPVFSFLAEPLDYVGQVCFIVFLYVFPDGRFVPRWMRWLAVAAALLWLPTIFSPGSPFALLNGPFIVGLIATTVVAQVYRYRMVSGPVERQQTKWVVFGVVVAIAGFSAMITFGFLVPSVEHLGPLVQMAASALVNGFLLLIPLSIGVAILRSRLYDIDIVINRALVYGALTVTLALVYSGSVVVLQYLFRALTGETSQIVVVASTLVIAALFNPLRRRIQSFIDHSFYRRKYDARKTLEAFSARLRDETNLDRLNGELVGVVKDTLQPAHVSLWLRDGGR